MSGLLNWFSGLSWEALSGVVAAFVLLFDRISKVLPTFSGSPFIAILQRIATFLGARVQDNLGTVVAPKA